MLPPPTTSPSPPRRTGAGFSLLELLIVLVILVIMLAAILPVSTRSMAANQLTTQGDALLNLLSDAHQRAISESRSIEVRFYHHLEPDDPSSGDVVRGVVLVAYDSAGQPVAVAPPLRFTAGVIVSMDGGLSTLADPASPHLISGIDPIGGSGLYAAAPGSPYLGFRFHHDGSTDLPADADGDTWHLTVLIGRLAPAATSADLPPNYYAIRIDSLTGRARAFRP